MSAIEPNEETLLERALSFSTDEARQAYLKGACGEDDKLRARVESLLQAHEAAGAFLKDKPASAHPDPGSERHSEQTGDRIGRYRLLEKIGEGGCGVVYMAEQEEPVKRRVALKVIKLGMDTRSVIARFEAERQALAMMDHSNIAKVHDGGATESGRPYFVMELVRGIKITEYCDENNLSTRARLDLFVQVCQAVQHAHQKGIIHRDLKPSNILVTINDGVPVPKVIDFGIAKATNGQELTDKTIFTAFQQFIGTPAYMSPEQALMTSLDIDTRSDIYSLGVLLYELLTGRTPLVTPELLKAGLDEMRRTIREKEPARPSNRLSTMAQNDLTTAAKRRSTSPPQLIHDVSGDLDWIVMKCLEKDRTRRYETANGLAADIQRQLSNEPIVARPPSAAYRVQKLVRRNKGTFAAASAIATALIVGLSLSVWQSIEKSRAFQRAEAALGQAQKAEQKAAEEAAVAKAVSDFLRNDLLRSAGTGYQARQLNTPANPNLTVVEALDRAAEKISDRFADRPLVEAGIRHTLGQTYLDLGNYLAAIRHLERGLELRRSKLGMESGDTRSTMNSLTLAYDGVGRYTDSTPLKEELLAFARARFGPDHNDTRVALHNLGLHLINANRPAEGVRLLEELLKQEEAQKGRENLTGILSSLATGYSFILQPAKAIALNEEALRNLRNTLGSDHLQTIQVMCNLAMCYRDAHRNGDALPLLEEGLRLRKSRLGPTHPDTLVTFRMLAELNEKLGRLAEAEAFFAEAAAAARTAPQNGPGRTASQIRDLAVFLSSKGRDIQAEPLFREALELARKVAGGDPKQVLDCLQDYAHMLYRQRRSTEAEALCREALVVLHQDTNRAPAQVEDGLWEIAYLYLRFGDFAAAEPVYRDLLHRREERLPARHLDVQDSAILLGRLLADWAWADRPAPSDVQSARPEMAKRAREAERLLRQSLAVYESNPKTSRGQLGAAKARLGGALTTIAASDPSMSLGTRLAMLREAEPFLLSGHALLQASRSIAVSNKREAIERLVRLYQAWTELAPNAGKPVMVAEWTQRLEAFDQAHMEKKTQTDSEVSE